MTARRGHWALLALLCLLAFAFQGTRGIWEPDEGRYTAAGVNMLESGDWLVPTVDGEHPHLTKPPLTYWALAASFGLFGHNEWAARLPAALAFVGTGLLVLGLGRRLCAPRPWLPAVVWALSPAPLVGANIISTDPLLVLFETAAMFAFVEAWSRDAGAARRWLLAMWVGWGLAFLTKGPPALLPLAALVAFLAVHDRPRLRALFPPAGLLLFALIALTWFAVVVWQQPDRLGYFLGHEVYDRVFTAKHDRNPEWYGGLRIYLPVFVVGALPWWPLALGAAGGPRQAWRILRARIASRDRQVLLLAYWFAVPLAVFMFARSRLELYVLPLFVPLALALARLLGHRAGFPGRRLAAWAGGTAVALLALKLAAAYWPSDRDARRIAAELRPVVQAYGIEEVAFIQTPALFGLTLYLDIHAESVHIGGPEREHARTLRSRDDLCTELAEQENNLYAVKRRDAGDLRAAVGACGRLEATEVGEMHADGHAIALFRVRPAADTPGG